MVLLNKVMWWKRSIGRMPRGEGGCFPSPQRFIPRSATLPLASISEVRFAVNLIMVFSLFLSQFSQQLDNSSNACNYHKILISRGSIQVYLVLHFPQGTFSLYLFIVPLVKLRFQHFFVTFIHIKRIHVMAMHFSGGQRLPVQAIRPEAHQCRALGDQTQTLYCPN